MAWAERLQSGKYRGCWRRPDGSQDHTRRATHPEHPYARKRDALEAAQEAEVTARRQAAASKGTISASTLWGEWWDLIIPDYPDSDTGTAVAKLVTKYLRPKWAGEALNGIEQRDVKAWVADLLPGREPSYVRAIYGVFRWSINQAVERNVLVASPCVGIKIPKPPKRAKPYTDEAYLDAIRPHLPAAYARDMAELGMETGLRPGELCGLHADVCDLETGWAVVSKVFVEGRRIIRHRPKDRDHRDVPLTDKANAIIARNLAGRELTAGCGVPHSNGKPCRSVLVFRNARGEVVRPSTFREAMKRAAEKAGVPYRGRGPYAVRRGMGTRAARGGIDMFELKEILGHADIKQTDEYVQNTPGARDRLRHALGETTPLTVVPGQVGAEPGAEPDQQAPHGPTPNEDRKGG